MMIRFVSSQYHWGLVEVGEDPVHERGESGVDSRVAWLSTSVTEADHAHQQPWPSILVIQHQRSSTVSLTRVSASISVARAHEHLCDWLKIRLVTVLIGPHKDGDSAQNVDLVTIIVGGAPSQCHGQCVSEGLVCVSSSGETDGLNILTEGHGSLESEDSNVIVETIGSEVGVSHHLLHLQLVWVVVLIIEVPLSNSHRELSRQKTEKIKKSKLNSMSPWKIFFFLQKLLHCWSSFKKMFIKRWTPNRKFHYFFLKAWYKNYKILIFDLDPPLLVLVHGAVSSSDHVSVSDQSPPAPELSPPAPVQVDCWHPGNFSFIRLIASNNPTLGHLHWATF